MIIDNEISDNPYSDPIHTIDSKLKSNEGNVNSRI